jgi:hypothetical protein
MSTQSVCAFKTLTDGATIAVDFSVAENNQVTLGGNRTFTFANPQVGVIYCLKLIQDSTGSRLATWPSTVVWAGGSAPTLTTTAAYNDMLYFMYDGSKYRDVAIVKNYAS